MPHESRHYKPIWDLIKANGSCSIVIDRTLFRRVKKAVSKEKLKDKEWQKNHKKELVFIEGQTKAGEPKLTIKLKANLSVRNII